MRNALQMGNEQWVDLPEELAVHLTFAFTAILHLHPQFTAEKQHLLFCQEVPVAQKSSCV